MIYKLALAIGVLANAAAKVPPTREELEGTVRRLEAQKALEKRELSTVVSPYSQVPSCGAPTSEPDRRRLDATATTNYRGGCHSFHNFGGGVLPSVIKPDGLEIGDEVCLKVTADSLDGLAAPLHNACYKKEGDKCPADAAVCKFDEAALEGQYCDCTHYKNGARPTKEEQLMCMTTTTIERTPMRFAERGPHICEPPKHGYEEVFGQRIPVCKHPAMACIAAPLKLKCCYKVSTTMSVCTAPDGTCPADRSQLSDTDTCYADYLPSCAAP